MKKRAGIESQIDVNKSGLEQAAGRIIPVLLIFYLIFLIIFGIKFHIMELPQTAEFDGYSLKADELRSGHLPRDPYRPLLYPILTAVAGELLDDTFAGGRLVSSLFACMFVLFAWRIGKLVLGELAGSITVVLLMLNFHVAIFGMSVSTDMMFTALISAVLFVSLLMVRKCGAGKAVLAGFLFAMAFFTRYSAAFIFPIPIIAVLINGDDRKWTARLFLILIFLVSALLFLIPHFTLNTKIFGSPVYNENWKNLAFKLYGEKDWSYFGRIHFNGLFDVIQADPVRWLRSFMNEFARCFTSVMYFLGGKGMAGYLFFITGTVALITMILRPDRYRVILILFLLLLAVGGSTIFFSGVRFMLPVIPLYYMAISWFAVGGDIGTPLHRKAGVRKIFAAIATLLILSTAQTSVRHLGLYIEAHPVEELEAAKELEKRYGSGITVLGSYPFIQRYVSYRYIELEKAGGKDPTSISWFDRLEEQILKEEANFIVAGSAYLASRLPGILDAGDLPDYLSVLFRDDDVTVYEVHHHAGPTSCTEQLQSDTILPEIPEQISFL